MWPLKKKAHVDGARQKEIEAQLRQYAGLPVEALYTSMHSAAQGLTAAKAEELLEEHGPNVITTGRNNTTAHRLREAVVNPFNIVLLLIAVVTFFTDVIFTDSPDFLTVGIILLLVGVSSAVAFVQSEKSNTAARNLSKMITNKADVWRDGALVELSMEQVVPGDVIKLAAGDMLPADVRFLSTKDTFVAQAALTGESAPVEKFTEAESRPEQALTDLSDIGFMGSNLISGSATAIVLATGNDTYFGSMARSLSGERAKNSFERGVDAVSKLLLQLMLVMVPVIFVINGLTKGNWVNSMLFAVTMAVGLTPEMLPVIMTSTLAKGAVSMSKRKVIVKSLGAIQAFGEMDLLCTDKTGTLTEDKIILEKYINVLGADDDRILRHAYLNSYFQTGLKNLIDIAIINRAQQNGMESLLAAYHVIDEIPFDFARRRMSVVLEDKDGKRQLITKGAVEEMLSISSFVEINGQVLPLDDVNRKQAMETYQQWNDDGLRMVAVAQKNEVPEAGAFTVADEQDMVLIGFVGFLDPPKESAAAAITALKEHGIRTVVLTGDSEGVAIKVCGKVGVDTSHVLTGAEVEAMDDAVLMQAMSISSLFAKLSPPQKQRVVRLYQQLGHTVGYMGDGINDAPALHQADVGISVDSAVDIAKETADIILLKKDLMVLEEGVLEGRRTFGNIIKYIKMAASGNFGNMISVLVASIFLPFLPMLPIQILTQNLLCDFAQMGIPFDNVDPEYLKKPRKWETRSIRTFMSFMGPLSSLSDILCYAVLWFIIGANTQALAPQFQAGWFVFGTISQVLVFFLIRTAKIPFLQSNASPSLYIFSLLVVGTALLLGFTGLGVALDMAQLPLRFLPWLAGILGVYFLSAQLMKRPYIRRFGEWI